MFDPSLGYEMGIYVDGITEDNFVAAYLPNIFMAVASFVFCIVCFVVCAKAKTEFKKEKETSYKTKWSGKRKFKFFCRYAGISLMALGALTYLGKPSYGLILIACGLPFFILSFIIRVRRNAESRNSNRFVDGNKITIKYKNDTRPLGAMRDMAKIIQDAYNDGYYVLEDFAEFNNGKEAILVFSTPLSNKEIQEQYLRREKYFNTRGKNAHEMPWYFSENVLISYHQVEHKKTGTHTEKVPVWNYEIKKTYEVERDAWGKEVGRKVVKEEKVKTTLSHYEVITYSDYTTIYGFLDKDKKPLKTANGKEATIVETYKIEEKREKVAK